MPEMNEYEYLDTTPEKLEPIAELINWAYNETFPNTYNLFLDLIGWTEENIGETLYNLNKKTPGYRELSYLANALQCYAIRPNDVREYIDGFERASLNGAGV